MPPARGRTGAAERPATPDVTAPRRWEVTRSRGTRPDRGSSTGHIAAVFPAYGNTYVVSLHVIDPYTAATAKATVARIVTGLVPVQPAAA